MSDFDDRIRDALGAEDAKLLEKLEAEPSIHQQLMETFRGRNRWLVVGCFVSIAVILVLTALATVQFFGTQDTNDRMAWGFGALLGFMSILGIKIWYWMELNKNILSREVKRLELQVAILTKKDG